MRNLSLVCVMVFYMTMLPSVATPAINQLSYWGKECALIAPVIFPIRSQFAVGGPDAYEGVKFPFYLGYLAFHNENNEHRIVFTPEPGYDASKLLSYFEKVNNDRYIYLHNICISIDDDEFTEFVIFIILWQFNNIINISSKPIGEFQRIDVNFQNQIVFRSEDVDKYVNYDLDELFHFEGITLTPKE